MKSHEYAQKIKEAAEFLLSKEEFEVDSTPSVMIFYYSQKTLFLDAVKAVGSGTKKYSSDDLIFTPGETCLHLYVNRNAVCRKVQEEKWECEPLLSGEEMEIVNQHEIESDIPF